MWTLAHMKGKRDQGFKMVNLHGVTPEIDRTTHYVWSLAVNAPPESRVAPIVFDQIYITINEGVAVLESQQRRIDDRPDVKFAAIASDGAVNHARGILASMQLAEQNFQSSNAFSGHCVECAHDQTSDFVTSQLLEALHSAEANCKVCQNRSWLRTKITSKQRISINVQICVAN
jgi:hypothetical protein